MKNLDLGVVIAERQFTRKSEPTSVVTLSIGIPRRFPDSDDYYVTYQIKGVGNESIKYVGGIDAVQCLQLVMNLIGNEMFVLNTQCCGDLDWDGDENGKLGFDQV